MAMRERWDIEADLIRHSSATGRVNRNEDGFSADLQLDPTYGGEVSLELLLDIRELLQDLNKKPKPTLKRKKRTKS